jgi:hypothetical protein
MESMPKLTETMLAVGVEIERISEVVSSGSAELGRVKGASNAIQPMLLIVRRMAWSLQKLADEVVSLGSEFTTQLHDVDELVRSIIALAPALAGNTGPGDDTICAFFNTVRSASRSATDGFGSLDGLMTQMQPIESIARDLRKPLRTLRQGLTMMSESRLITNDWLRLIDESPLQCPAGLGAIPLVG